MAIPTSRAKEKAEIRINLEKCDGCGLCVSVCKDFGLQIVDKKVTLTEKPLFGCIGCGHCMAICPEGAIEIYGRELTPADLFELPGREDMAGYGPLLNLLRSRRSIREFREKTVDPELIGKILDAARTAPMGLPPSDVNILVLANRERVREFSKDYCAFLYGMRWFFSTWFLALMKPFWGKANDEMFRDFLRPLFQVYTGNMKNGVDLVTYDAPLAMYFYGSPYTDPADPLITATYAMIAGESLRLGTCMLGGIHPFIQYGKRGRAFREKHGIRFKSREGLFVIFGHPKVTYVKGIRRTLSSEIIRN